MSPQTSQLREAMIKLAAMKIAYRRAWHNKKHQLLNLYHYSTKSKYQRRIVDYFPAASKIKLSAREPSFRGRKKFP